jgi:hypothetical protein
MPKDRFCDVDWSTVVRDSESERKAEYGSHNYINPSKIITEESITEIPEWKSI